MRDRPYVDGVLVDTSVWIEFFRNDTNMSRALADLLTAGHVITAGVVIFEVTQGIRSAKEKSTITGLFSDLNYVEMSQDFWASAGELSRSLKGRGLNLPLSDILLASIAINSDLPLFTLDIHFDSVPEVKRYKFDTARR